MELTRDNYHSLEANRDYWSNSLYQKFCDCETAALAYLRGEYVEEETDALLAGRLLHSWNEGKFGEFLEQHKAELMTKAGELKSPFKIIPAMTAVLEADPRCMWALNGDGAGKKESIHTAEFAGAPWKVMLDSDMLHMGYFSDLKSCRDLREYLWSDEYRARVHFLEAYHYPRQMALYSEITRLTLGITDRPEAFMVLATKQDPPDIQVISFLDPARTELELDQIKLTMPRFLAVKAEAEAPKSCGVCAWCRKTKKIDRILHYTELMR